MKSRNLFSALPLLFVASPALAQNAAAPVDPAAPAPVVVEPAPAPVAAPAPLVEPAPLAAPAEAPAPLPEPAPEEKPKLADKVAVGKSGGFFQPSATLQFWAFGAHKDDEWTQTTFRLRRAEIKIKGEIIPKTIGYMVMIDPARALEFGSKKLPVSGEDPAPTKAGTVTALQPDGSVSIMQDFQISFLSEFADVSVGQFKNQLSWEGTNTASKLMFPERSRIARKYGDRRDIGLKVEKKFKYVSYAAGVFNGEGQNKLDSNDQKDLVLRLEAYPVDGLLVGAVGYTAVGERDLAGTKDRIEGDLRFEKYGLLLQGEYLRGWDRNATKKVEGQGFYVAAGYTLFEKLQPVVRIGSVDPDVDNDLDPATGTDANDEFTDYEFGLNYFISGHEAKLQAAAAFLDPEQKSSKTEFNFTLAAQVSF